MAFDTFEQRVRATAELLGLQDPYTYRGAAQTGISADFERLASLAALPHTQVLLLWLADHLGLPGRGRTTRMILEALTYLRHHSDCVCFVARSAGDFKAIRERATAWATQLQLDLMRLRFTREAEKDAEPRGRPDGRPERFYYDHYDPVLEDRIEQVMRHAIQVLEP